GAARPADGERRGASRRQAGRDPLPHRGPERRVLPAGDPARDRTEEPDPDPPRRGWTSGGRRPPLRQRGQPAWTPRPTREAPGLHASDERGAAGLHSPRAEVVRRTG